VERAPFGDIPVATIDPDDVGAVAAAALTSEAHAERAYRLSGPESLRPPDRVAILAEVLGRDLRFDGQPNDEARAEMSAAMPAEQVLATVEQVTGSPPRSFRDRAAAHRDAFARCHTR
jgi:uncharacterized protein YbjT (DUF2867 family)